MPVEAAAAGAAMTTHDTHAGPLWPAAYHHAPDTWLRCFLCGIAHQLRDMDEIGNGRFICNSDTASPLCHRRRVELGAVS